MKVSVFGMIFFVVAIVSCKKDSSTPPPTPGPLEKNIVSAALLLNTPTNVVAQGSGNYEYGIKFGVTTNGKVTALSCRMPTAGTYRVTLWDGSVTPKVVLSTASITVAAGGMNTASISPIAITTGKDYFLTIWSSGQWFYITPASGSSFSYPITQGSVQIKGYQWVSSAQTPQTFPTTVDNTYIAGIMDFSFQPD
jgi:hypothetical protein